MLEVMDYLRANGFRTYIVTGGGQEFVRVYSEEVYGVPPEQVVGSSIATKYEMKDGKPVLMREPKVFFVDDGPGKAHRHQPLHRQAPADRLRQLRRRPRDAGMDHRRRRRPASASWCCTTTPTREFAYGPANGLPDSHVGTFTQALMDDAKAARLDGDQHEGRLEPHLRRRRGQGEVTAGRTRPRRPRRVPLPPALTGPERPYPRPAALGFRRRCWRSLSPLD